MVLPSHHWLWAEEGTTAGLVNWNNYYNVACCNLIYKFQRKVLDAQIESVSLIEIFISSTIYTVPVITQAEAKINQGKQAKEIVYN